MTPLAQKLALAKLLLDDIYYEEKTGKFHWKKTYYNYITNREWLYVVHECEKKLTDKNSIIEEGYSRADDYALNLLSIVGTWKPKSWGGECEADFAKVANATFEQRSEALLKTLGLWKEETKQ